MKAAVHPEAAAVHDSVAVPALPPPKRAAAVSGIRSPHSIHRLVALARAPVVAVDPTAEPAAVCWMTPKEVARRSQWSWVGHF